MSERGREYGAVPKISVIIPNFNYEAYLGPAIDSALNLDWPDVEVIVVDDGSTDDSRAVIARYCSRISVILQENSGQLVACNKGFAMSRGDIVIFLDSDDLLHPLLARELVAVWTPRTSKVQVQMLMVDAQGRATGSVFPQYYSVPTPEEVRAWSTHTTAYPTPPGSGNAYSRWFLERIFPLVNTCGTANDSYCLAAAPHLGDVITVAKPLVSYRIHGKNQGAMSKLDVHQFGRQLTRAHQRFAYAQGIARGIGAELHPKAIDRSLGTLCYRLASLKLAPDAHPIPGDSVRRVLGDVAAAFLAPQGVDVQGRIAIFVWFWVVSLVPVTLARRLILWRFAPVARPSVLRGVLTQLRVVKSDVYLHLPVRSSEAAIGQPVAAELDAAGDLWLAGDRMTASTLELSPSRERHDAQPTSELRLAIVIPNFNYAEFVGEAIDSALAVDWPHVRVIVVDDGSTDASREVIARYEGRITTVLQDNAGQFEAYNAGFRLVTEEVVIFLDSDDLLDRSVMREIAAVWRPGLSKVQYRMRTVDAVGQFLGSVIPQYDRVPTPEEIRRWAATTTAYPTPPGSGNAYSRSYLMQIFPLDDSCGRPGDASCVAAAPFLGDVLTIPTVLGSYRIHGRNDGAASRLDAQQFQLHVVRAQQRHVYAQRMARRVGIDIDDLAINRSLSYLPYRLASLRAAPATHCIAGDTAPAVLRDVLRALPKPQGMSPKAKFAIAVWAGLVAVLPRLAGNRLILWRFVPAARPRALRAMLLKFKVIR
ncbi:MAG: glycosyltransferase [Burkholderiales bacterium]